jgi:hypothetical protein
VCGLKIQIGQSAILQILVPLAVMEAAAAEPTVRR